jgi:hypothetical protein
MVAKLFLMNLKNIFLFLLGFVIGSFLFSWTISDFKVQENVFKAKNFNKTFYETKLSDKLFDEIKVLCMVMTNPKNHGTKAIHVKNTWGRRCNKLLFITSQEDPRLDTIVLDVTESRKALRNKTKASFLYAHENHLDEFDWFMKADDDK